MLEQLYMDECTPLLAHALTQSKCDTWCYSSILAWCLPTPYRRVPGAHMD